MMILVMELFKVLGRRAQIAEMIKVLAPKKHLIKDVLKMFDNPITPRFSQGNKDRLYPQMQAETDDDTERMRIMITAPTGK